VSGAYGTHGKENCIEIFGSKREGKEPPVKPMCRRGNDIKICLTEKQTEFVDWIHLPQNKHQWRALVKVVKKLLDP